MDRKKRPGKARASPGHTREEGKNSLAVAAAVPASATAAMPAAPAARRRRGAALGRSRAALSGSRAASSSAAVEFPRSCTIGGFIRSGCCCVRRPALRSHTRLAATRRYTGS